MISCNRPDVKGASKWNEAELAVGLDVHQQFVQICVQNRQGRVLVNHRVPNTIAAICRAVRRYGQRARLALECGSGTAALADGLIVASGWDVHLCHPGYVRRMKQNPDKTDLGDAQVLADLVRCGYLPRVWLAPPAIRDLRTLVRYRQQIVDRRRATKLRIRALLREHRLPPPESLRLWSKAGLTWLIEQNWPAHAGWVLGEHLDELLSDTRRLARVTVELRHCVTEDPLLQELLTEPGIGLVTACVLRAEIGHFGRFRNGKQLARFCGLSPCNFSSGQHQAEAGLVRGCSKLLRATLIEAAHRLTRQDPHWKTFKAELRERGKAGSLIAAAVANRWMRGLHHRLRELEQRGLEQAA